jgi:hypothetical protein
MGGDALHRKQGAARSIGDKKCSPSGKHERYKLRSMKTNLPYTLKSPARVRQSRIEANLELPILLLFLVALAVAGCETLESGPPGAVVAPSSPWPVAASYGGETGFAAGLSGQWFHDGRPTSISVDPDGRNVMIINENGQRSSGYANSPYELEIPSLRIKGHVSHGGRRISWTNGTEWTREPRHGGSDSGWGQGISGRWYHDGKPTSISVSGQSVTITNEAGQSSNGSLSGNDIVIGGLRGLVSHNGKRISWSNGTEWRR